jgi:2-oxo-4-hydroxy-4-carboxy--5-ureidoimidazoline (OHCU) decarboxylase
MADHRRQQHHDGQPGRHLAEHLLQRPDREGGLVEEVTPTARLQEKIPLSQLNRLGRIEFVDKVGRFFQGGDWIAESAWEKRPFQSIYELRRALQEAVFNAPSERQVELIRSYPDLGRMLEPEQASLGVGSRDRSGSYNVLGATPFAGLLAVESLRDQSSAGLDRLSPEEHESFSKLNSAYRDKFGFPLVVCVRENTKETILASGKERLENSPAQEKASALIEIAKIANLRLQDLIEAPAEEATIS